MWLFVVFILILDVIIFLCVFRKFHFTTFSSCLSDLSRVSVRYPSSYQINIDYLNGIYYWICFYWRGLQLTRFCPHRLVSQNSTSYLLQITLLINLILCLLLLLNSCLVHLFSHRLVFTESKSVSEVHLDLIHGALIFVRLKISFCQILRLYWFWLRVLAVFIYITGLLMYRW